jgi:hypothetical protein
MIRLLMFLALWLPAQTGVGPSGQVIDEVTRAPVAGARVLFALTDGRTAKSVVVETDDSGRFVLRTLPTGPYRVFVEGPGYLRREVPADAKTIALTPTAVIAGHVRSERGDPAPKIYVRAWSVAGKLVAETQTNDLGEYRLFDLVPGEYVISAERYQGPRIEGTFLVMPTPPCPDCPGEGQGRYGVAQLLTQGAFIDPRVIAGRTYPQVFFPAATERPGATPLQVAAGQQLGGVDLALIVR